MTTPDFPPSPAVPSHRPPVAGGANEDTARIVSPRLGRRPALDGIRGLAIALVLCRHSSNWLFGGGGIVGVNLFFVLSGFLITTLLLQEWSDSGRLQLRLFYARRAVRLLPALFVMLAVYVMVALVVNDGAQRLNVVLSALSAITYTVPFALAGGFSVDLPISATWTLCIEEYYYFVWPIVLILMLRAGWRGGRLFRAIAALLVVAVLIRVATYFVFSYRIYTAPTTWVDALLGGSALAVAFNAGWFARLRISPAWIWPAVLALVGLSFWPGLRTSPVAYGPGLTFLVICEALIITLAVGSASSAHVRWLTWAPLRWLGRRSYAVYLWNSIFLLTAPTFLTSRPWQIVLGVAASLLVAELSWRLVETPFQRRFHDRLRPRAQLVPAVGDSLGAGPVGSV